MTKIIFATGNKDKLREIKEILSDCDVEIQSMKEAGINVDIVEDGKTFEDNALIKARAIAAHTDAIVLADDSGLEIDYLNKEPGVYSARYMGEDTSYDIKNNNLIERLDGVPKEKRTARFVCAIAAVIPDGRELVTRTGIMTRLTFSTPCWTPHRTMTVLISTKMTNQVTGLPARPGACTPMKLPKKESDAVSSMTARIFSINQSGNSSATSSRQPEAPAFSQCRMMESSFSMM